MIAFGVMIITGFLFGYLIVEPFNRGYTALAWAGVMMVCGSAYGALIIIALSLATPATGKPLDLLQELVAIGFALLYALSASVGTYLAGRGNDRTR